MADLTISLNLTCKTCGGNVYAYSGGGSSVAVQPCQTCINRADDVGWIKGYEKGHSDCKEGVPA